MTVEEFEQSEIWQEFVKILKEEEHNIMDSFILCESIDELMVLKGELRKLKWFYELPSILKGNRRIKNG